MQIVQVQSELRPLLRPLSISVSLSLSPTFLSTNSSSLSYCSSSSLSMPRATPAASHRITLALAYLVDSCEIGRKGWKRAGNVRNRFKWLYIRTAVLLYLSAKIVFRRSVWFPSSFRRIIHHPQHILIRVELAPCELFRKKKNNSIRRCYSLYFTF